MNSGVAILSRPQAVFAASRPSFLVLAPATVLLGVGTAVLAGAAIAWQQLAAVLIGALAAHIAVNTLNEYQDFHSGLDAVTERTPFSGGSGALPAQPEAARGVLLTALAAIGVTVLVGLYLAWLHGPAIIAIGLAGLAIIISYTKWLNRRPWLCLLAPGLGFGPLMVIGSHIALGGEFGWPPLLAGGISLCLVSNLLLLNQYPDMAADRSVGRHTFPIAYGIARSNTAYAVLLGTATLLLIGAVATGQFPLWSLVALAPLLCGALALRIARRFAGDSAPLLPALGLNVAAAVLTPLVLGIALLTG
jgi:1,4-dihydroxy-2-naphthoate octaprenyltransferase